MRLAWSDDDFGVGEAAPLEPYDGVSLGAVGGGARRLRARCCAAPTRAPATPSCSPRARPSATCREALAAIDLALWDRAGRRAGRPVARAARGGRGGAGAVNATLGAEDRAGAAAQAAAAARRGLRLREGQGRDRRRRGTGGRGPRRGRAGDGDPRRRQRRMVDRPTRRWRTCARSPAPGWSTPRSRSTASTPSRAVRAARVVPVAMDETAAEPGAVGSGATDAVCLKVSRCGGITGADARRARGARGGQRGVRGVVVRRPARGRGGGPRRGGARGGRSAAVVRAGDAGAFAGFEGVLAPVAGSIAVPRGPGLLGDAGAGNGGREGAGSGGTRGRLRLDPA